jgi:hypothetical protein
MERIILSGIIFTRHHIGTSTPNPATNLQWGSDGDGYGERYNCHFYPPHVFSESPDLPQCTSTHTGLVRVILPPSCSLLESLRHFCRGTLLESPRQVCHGKNCRIYTRTAGEVVTTNELQAEIEEK